MDPADSGRNDMNDQGLLARSVLLAVALKCAVRRPTAVSHKSSDAPTISRFAPNVLKDGVQGLRQPLRYFKKYELKCNFQTQVTQLMHRLSDKGLHGNFEMMSSVTASFLSSSSPSGLSAYAVL